MSLRLILCSVAFLPLFSILPISSVHAQARDILIKEVVDQPAPPKKNCPCPPSKKKTDAWDLNLSLGFNLTQGNVSSRLMTAGFDAAREKDKNIYKFLLSAAEGEQESETTQRFLRANTSYDRLISDRVYTGVGASILTDKIADVDYRGVLNTGFGYFFFKSDTLKFSVESGPAYVFERQGDINDNYFAVRFADDFSWKFSETASLFKKAEILLNTERGDDYLIIAKAGIQATLTSMISLVLSVEDRFDNSPAENRKRNDVIITSSLKFNF
jgi:putative salt-induced outer membrane protein YdiY